MRRPFAIVISLFLLSACGVAKEDRIASGGLIGAGTGAVVGAPFGVPVTGAAVGAGVGMAVGGLTPPNELNFGRPWWK